MTNNINKFYVYVYLDPRKPGVFKYENLHFDYEPFYVGEGSGNRFKEHLHKDTRNKEKSLIIKDIIQNKLSPIICFLKKEIKESEALRIERKTINSIGRKDLNKGPLTNLINGGQGNSNPSKEVRLKISKGNKGKKCSEETKLKIKQNHARLSGKSNSFYGKKHSLKTKNKWSKIRLGQKLSDKTKEKIRISHNGIEHSEKTKIKMRNTKSSKKIIQKNLNGLVIKVWNSISEIKREMGFSRSCISRCCHRKRISSYGFQWQFA